MWPVSKGVMSQESVEKAGCKKGRVATRLAGGYAWCTVQGQCQEGLGVQDRQRQAQAVTPNSSGNYWGLSFEEAPDVIVSHRFGGNYCRSLEQYHYVLLSAGCGVHLHDQQECLESGTRLTTNNGVLAEVEVTGDWKCNP